MLIPWSISLKSEFKDCQKISLNYVNNTSYDIFTLGLLEVVNQEQMCSVSIVPKILVLLLVFHWFYNSDE